MIGADSDGMFRSSEVMMPRLETFDDSNHFAVVDIIIAFYNFETEKWQDGRDL